MDRTRELLRGNTPTLVLAVLRDQPRHGYAIAREIARRSGHTLQFREGTLYPALHALEREGLVVSTWEPQPGGRDRRIYTITPAGRAALARRTHTWTEFSAAIHRVLEGADHVGTEGTPAGRPGLQLAG